MARHNGHLLPYAPNMEAVQSPKVKCTWEKGGLPLPELGLSQKELEQAETISQRAKQVMACNDHDVDEATIAEVERAKASVRGLKTKKMRGEL